MTLEEYKKLKEEIVKKYINNYEEKINEIEEETNLEIEKFKEKEDDIIDE